MSIRELEADFVFVYNNKDKAIDELIEYLYSKGVYCQIRDYNAKSFLVFIKVAQYKYKELAAKDSIRNYEFGISTSIDNHADKLRIVYDYLVGSTLDDVNLAKYKEVEKLTPVTSSIKSSTIYEDISKLLFTAKVPTTEFIKENFGIHIALYFEFMKYFIKWVNLLAIFGVVSYWKSRHVYSLTYCIVNLIWGALFICFWKRRENYLIACWGSLNCHLIQEHQLKLADINERFETKSGYKHNNNYEGIKFLKQLCFIPVALAIAVILVSYQLGCFVLEIFIADIYDGPGKVFISLLPTILISVFVPILTMMYNVISDIFVKFENHNNSYTKNNSILLKQFILNFLTSYMPLLITAFIYLPFAHLIEPNLGYIQSTVESSLNPNTFYYKYLVHLKSQQEFHMNQNRLNMQYNYFIVTNQVIQLVMKYILPHIISFAVGLLGDTKYKPKDDPKEAAWMATIRKYISLPSYNVDDDIRFIIVTYGYLILFGPVWSLGPVITVVFLIITIKLDYFKLLNGKYYKPPVPERVDSIYPWNYALFLLTWFGSIIAPAITTFYRHGDEPIKSMGQFALDKASVNVTSLELIVVLLSTEHIFFSIWFVFRRVFELFKSKVEWDNDFSDNDIKLRHDFYSANVKLDLSVGDDADWKAVTVSETVSQAKDIIKGQAPKLVEPPVIAVTSGVETSVVSGIEDSVSELQQRKSDDEDIIQIPNQGGTEYALIDNNQHIDPRRDFNETESQYQQDFEAKQHRISPEDIVRNSVEQVKEENIARNSVEQVKEEDNVEQVSIPSTKSKRKGLKKLIKRR